MKEAMQDVVRAKLESVRVELEGWAMGPWGHGAMGPWGHGAMGPWGHGAMGPWGHGAMGPAGSRAWPGRPLLCCGQVKKRVMPWIRALAKETRQIEPMHLVIRVCISEISIGRDCLPA